jgi:hypothetical protein
MTVTRVVRNALGLAVVSTGFWYLSPRALPGVVSVTTDERHKWQSGTCDVVVEGNCIAS